MATLSFGGIGSGIDINGIVTGLTNAQRAPYESRVLQQQAGITTDISAMGALKGALGDVSASLEKLKEAENFQQRTASGRDDFIGISVDKTAEPGSYDIKVDRLAEAHKLFSAGFASDEKVGEGTLQLASGGVDFTLDISADDTLSDIKDKINNQSGNNNISATIITEDDGSQHLVLNANKTGLDNAISMIATPTGASRLSELHYDPADLPNSNLTELNAAQDAQITIDGAVTITSSNNDFENAIEGVSLTVKKVHDVGEDSTMAITENNSAIEAALNSFVSAYNSLMDMSDQLGKAGGDEGVGPLVGDSMLRGIMTKVRKEITNTFSSGTDSQLTMTQLGISSDRYGKLSFDSERFQEQSDKAPASIEQFFVGTETKPGFAGSLDNLIGFYTDSNGLIDNRINSYNTQLERIDDDMSAFNKKMDAYQDRLFKQYNHMDALVAGMNATSDYLQQQLANLPGVVKQSK